MDKYAHKSLLFANNSRSILLTSVLCKVMKRMINIRLQTTLLDRKVIPIEQAGFQPGRSTLEQLVFLSNSMEHHRGTSHICRPIS
ncbi:hypothetical protein PGB90_009807 [Kerria lacca]